MCFSMWVLSRIFSIICDQDTLMVSKVPELINLAKLITVKAKAVHGLCQVLA